MTANQTPSGVKLLELPKEIVCAANVYSSFVSGENFDALKREIQAYALACVEADRKERAVPNPYPALQPSLLTNYCPLCGQKAHTDFGVCPAAVPRSTFKKKD